MNIIEFQGLVRAWSAHFDHERELMERTLTADMSVAEADELKRILEPHIQSLYGEQMDEMQHVLKRFGTVERKNSKK